MLDYRERLIQVSTAMADATRRRIFEYLAESESPLTARQVAEHFGLHVNAARVHLDKLVASGMVRVIRRRGTLGGRPAYHYQLLEDQDELHFPPRHYRLLADILTAVMTGKDDPYRLRILQEARRRGYREAARESSPLLEVRGSNAQALAQAWGEDLARRGLRVRGRVTEEGEVEIVFLGCPFGGLSRERGELVCDIHAALEEGRLRQAGDWILRRRGRCVFLARREKKEDSMGATED
ncbi:MAG: helix-turn-helix transcriptional regulator [Actinomycetota bacterium]